MLTFIYIFFEDRGKNLYNYHKKDLDNGLLHSIAKARFLRRAFHK